MRRQETNTTDEFHCRVYGERCDRSIEMSRGWVDVGEGESTGEDERAGMDDEHDVCGWIQLILKVSAG